MYIYSEVLKITIIHIKYLATCLGTIVEAKKLTGWSMVDQSDTLVLAASIVGHGIRKVFSLWTLKTIPTPFYICLGPLPTRLHTQI